MTKGDNGWATRRQRYGRAGRGRYAGKPVPFVPFKSEIQKVADDLTAENEEAHELLNEAVSLLRSEWGVGTANWNRASNKLRKFSESLWR